MVCKVASVEDIRRLDRMAEEVYGISPVILMENAGNAVYAVIEREIGIKYINFLVVAGPGNNGGDGFAAARKLYSNGASVKVAILADPNKYSNEAKLNYEIIKKLPIEKYYVDRVDEEFLSLIEEADVIVDAIFGVGISKPVTGVYFDAIKEINESGKLIVSVDIPSGVNGDTGEVMGIAVKADYTVTFGLPKRGLFLFPGAEYVGKLYLSHISYPPELYNDESIKVQLNEPVMLPERRMDTHKGDYGKALFIAGSSRYLGAPYLAALSFLKAGGGLSYLATPKSVAPFIISMGPEIVPIPLKETEEGTISLENLEFLIEFSKKNDFVIIGPGISLNSETQEFVRKIVPHIDKPLIIDGDGLTAISKDPMMIRDRKQPTILTPHFGEMSRLTGLDIDYIKRNKIDVVMKYCNEWNAIIILKGAYSLIGYPDGTVYINTSGNPGMATAGSGDVLTGCIAAMYGLGLSVDDAVRMGVFIHGLAGDLAAEKVGMDGVTATTILNYVPKAVKYLRENFEEIVETQNYTVYKI